LAGSSATSFCCLHTPAAVRAVFARPSSRYSHYDPLTGETIVDSAWGEQTDWYRNIQARDALHVRTGSEWYIPRQRILPPDEAAAVFEDWTRRQRWFAQLMLAQVGEPLDVTETGRAALVARFPFVAFSPSGDQPLSSGSSA
jgi:hypothetical protein